MIAKRFGTATVLLERDPLGVLICKIEAEKASYPDTMRALELAFKIDRRLVAEREQGFK